MTRINRVSTAMTGDDGCHHPSVKSSVFSCAFLPYKQAAAAALPKMVIKMIDILTLNISVVARALDFVWVSYRGPHMLIESLLENSHPKSSRIARLGNNH